VGEAVIDMYKTDYLRPIDFDRVSIDKARRLISTKQTDTLGAKIQGGPTLPLFLDLVKNSDDLLNDETLRNYDLTTDVPEMIDDRAQTVINFRHREGTGYSLYYGKIYVDSESLAITRVEMNLDMADKERATKLMLVSKPAGVKFKPREMSMQVNYKTEDGVTRISYVRSTSRFVCDWKKRLFRSSYVVNSEMVVTDRYPKDKVKQIPRRDSFKQRASLYDNVELFDAPDFWGRDNIIEPTESLENAIEKLKKRLR